ncbi:MAG: hypothetical protein OEM41_06960 [Ignavibacteria bacterium]|nr:hypothetical protein [Ignavibacteria bacterium]
MSRHSPTLPAIEPGEGELSGRETSTLTEYHLKMKTTCVKSLLSGLTCVSVLVGCTAEIPVGPTELSPLPVLRKTASREGTIEIKRLVTYRGRDTLRDAFFAFGEVLFTIDPMQNVKQEAFTISVVLDATLVPVSRTSPACLVYGAALSVVTPSGKGPVTWDERFYVERDGGSLYLFVRFTLDGSTLAIQEMWIDCPSAPSLSAL